MNVDEFRGLSRLQARHDATGAAAAAATAGAAAISFN